MVSGFDAVEQVENPYDQILRRAEALATPRTTVGGAVAEVLVAKHAAETLAAADGTSLILMP